MVAQSAKNRQIWPHCLGPAFLKHCQNGVLVSHLIPAIETRNRFRECVFIKLYSHFRFALHVTAVFVQKRRTLKRRTDKNRRANRAKLMQPKVWSHKILSKVHSAIDQLLQ